MAAPFGSVSNENVEKTADDIYKMMHDFSRNIHPVRANDSMQYNFPLYSQFIQPPIPPGGVSVPFPYLIQPNSAYDQNVMQFLQRNSMEQNNTTIQIGIGQQFNNQFVQNQQSTQQQNPTQFQQQGTRIMKSSCSDNSSVSAIDLQSMDDVFDAPKSPHIRIKVKEKHENNESQQIDHVFCNLQRIALQGCDIAEKLVQNHNKRPCFKKIDLLCGRLKQDLTNNNNVVANINSQGVAWAVKDFIFIFTRIINAWVIMRGYVYNKSDGLNRIKDAMDSDLTRSFLAWQEATANLSESLVKSYVNLDRMVQHQRNNSKDSKVIGISDLKNHPKQYDADFLHEMHQKLFNPTFAENSEETQRRHDENGTYFKSAVYKPLSNDKFNSPNASHRSDLDLFKIFNNDTMHEDSEACSQVLSPKPLYKRSQLQAPMSAPSKILKNPFKMKLDLVEQFDIFGLANEKRPHRIIQKSLNFGDGDKNNNKFNNQKIKENYKSTKKNRFFDVDSLDVGSMVDIFGNETTNQIKFMLDEILSLPQAICFMCPTLYKNQNTSYYENYILLKADGESMNLNRIVRDIQFGKYLSILEIIHDFKVIVQNAKIVMSGNRDERAVATIQSFVSGVEDVLQHNMLANSVDD